MMQTPVVGSKGEGEGKGRRRRSGGRERGRIGGEGKLRGGREFEEHYE